MINGKSDYTAGLFMTIVFNLVASTIIVLSLGILTPFAIVIRQQFVASHTYIEGKQLEFVGTGMGLFGQWIKWFLLTIITLGIYGFWVNLKMHQWVIRNTQFRT
ncbi:DUF898 domain-containing protein [Methanobacterium sp. YSL]|nr:DUF898 domain-containing protein [Methanobacterium sp. YSL]